jgi:hypothetical protein
MADDKSVISYDNIISPTETFDVLFSNLDNLEARLKKLAKGFNDDLKFINVNDTVAIEKQALALRKLELAEEKLRLKKDALANAQKKKIKLTNEELLLAQKEKITEQDRLRRAKLLAIIETEKGRTVKNIRAQLSLTTIAWSRLTTEEIKNGKSAKLIVKRKLDLTNELKNLEQQTGDTRRNVGNYTESLKKLGKTSTRVFLGRSAVDFFRRIVSGAKDIIDANRNSSESLGDLGNSIDEAGGAFTKLATAILTALAPAITLIIDGFTAFVGIFVDLDEEANSFVATSEDLNQSIKGLEKGFAKEAAAADQVFTALGNANIGSKERKRLIDEVNKQYGRYLPNLLTEASSLREVAAAQDLVNEGISKEFLLKVKQETQTDIFVRKANRTQTAFKEISEEAGRVGEGIIASISDFQDFAEILSKNSNVSSAFVASTAGQTSDQITAILKGAKDGLDLFAVQLSLAERAGANVVDPFNALVKDTFLRNKAINSTSNEINSLESNIVTFDRAVTDSTGSTSSNTKVLKDNTAERLKAIEELQVALEALEVGSIEDRQKRALALEDLRFKEEQKLRKLNEIEFAQLLKEQEDNLIDFYGKKDKRVIAFRAAAGVELLKVEAVSLKLGEEQLADSEENKIKILEDFDKKRIDRATKAVEQAQAVIKKDADDFAKVNKAITDEQQKSIQSEADLEQKARKEKNKKRIDDEKQLSKDIISLTSETSKAIQSVFDAEVKAAGDAVAAQVTAVSNAETRAKAGLENTLKFEQEQLASKELQRQQTEKRAKQAAEALALINLTVAAAQSGDKNAVQTGLVKFGVLKGLVAAIGSFYHGTEDTGTVSNPLDSNGGRLAVLHNNERVVTASDNKKLGGMTNKELTDNAIRGAAMTDHQNPSMSLGSNHYQEQTKKVLSSSQSTSLTIDVSGLKDEMRATRRAIEKKPVVQETITGIINDVVTVARKTTTNRMTKAEIIKKRL